MPVSTSEIKGGTHGPGSFYPSTVVELRIYHFPCSCVLVSLYTSEWSHLFIYLSGWKLGTVTLGFITLCMFSHWLVPMVWSEEISIDYSRRLDDLFMWRRFDFGLFCVQNVTSALNLNSPLKWRRCRAMSLQTASSTSMSQRPSDGMNLLPHAPASDRPKATGLD